MSLAGHIETLVEFARMAASKIGTAVGGCPTFRANVAVFLSPHKRAEQTLSWLTPPS
jgi:hypothetical protein